MNSPASCTAFRDRVADLAQGDCKEGATMQAPARHDLRERDEHQPGRQRPAKPGFTRATEEPNLQSRRAERRGSDAPDDEASAIDSQNRALASK